MLVSDAFLIFHLKISNIVKIFSTLFALITNKTKMLVSDRLLDRTSEKSAKD